MAMQTAQMLCVQSMQSDLLYRKEEEEEEVGTRVYPLPNYRFPRQHLRGAPQPSSPPSATGSSGVLE